MVEQSWQVSDFLKIQINPRRQWNNHYKIFKGGKTNQRLHLWPRCLSRLRLQKSSFECAKIQEIFIEACFKETIRGCTPVNQTMSGETLVKNWKWALLYYFHLWKYCFACFLSKSIHLVSFYCNIWHWRYGVSFLLHPVQHSAHFKCSFNKYLIN